MNLSDYTFPVVERPLAVHNGQHDFADFDQPDTHLTGPYKALVREDTNQLISVVKDTYQLVPNKELIDQLLSSLVSIGTAFKLDTSHSFVENAKMRLQITFPELYLQDSESDIALSLFLENSYDLSNSVRFYFGSIRAICTNGQVFGTILAKQYAKHTKGFNLNKLADSLEDAKRHFPLIQHRINELEYLKVDDKLLKVASEKISKRLVADLIQEHEVGRLSQWKLLNRLTHYISHDMEQRKRARYQQAVSEVFAL